MLHPTVEGAVERYLASLDRLLPGVVAGFHLVGSVALGAYRDGRSDIDFVAVVEGEPTPSALRRLRAVHVRSGVHTSVAAVRGRRSPLSGTCNGVFVRDVDLSKPVSDIVPVASHTGVSFSTGPVGSDVSPVAWKVLAERGIAVRGPEAASLSLDPQPELLRSWNLGNLRSYWRPWAERIQRSPGVWFRRFRLRPRWATAWGVLGPPRLHHTFVTGEVISKEAAGEYALDVFPRGFHPLIAEALAYWRGEPDRLRVSPRERGHRTAELALTVVEATEQLDSSSPT